MEYVDKLKSYISKYKEGYYNENDLKASIDSLSFQITEFEYNDLRERLQKMEADLERVDFTVESEKIKYAYLEIIGELEKEINQLG